MKLRANYDLNSIFSIDGAAEYQSGICVNTTISSKVPMLCNNCSMALAMLIAGRRSQRKRRPLGAMLEVICSKEDYDGNSLIRKATGK